MKPFSLTIQEGRRLVALCEQNGVKLVINLASTELYLACYESSKRRDRIDLPLPDQDGFPLDELADSAVDRTVTSAN
jgi:hypothetical protein